MTNVKSILKSRDITLLTKVCIVKAVVFPVVKSRYKSWTINKAKHQRTGAFKLQRQRRFLRVPWTARRSNQPILKEINPVLEGLLLKLKFQYFCHLIQRVNSLEKKLMLRKTEGKRRRGQQRMRQLDCINNSTDMNVSKLQDTVEDRQSGVLQSMESQRVGHDLAKKHNNILI